MARYDDGLIVQPGGGQKFTGASLADFYNELLSAIVSGHYATEKPVGAAKGLLWSKNDGSAAVQLMLFDGTLDHMIAKWDDVDGLQINGAAVDRFTDLLDGAVPAPNGSTGVLQHDGTWVALPTLVSLAAEPISIAGAGVGQVTRLFADANNILYAPAGGTWECNWYGQVDATGNISQGDYVVVAGGTALGGPAPGLSLHGFAKRIA